jgi:hypothetical protein
MDINSVLQGRESEYDINRPTPPQCNFCDKAELEDASKAPMIRLLFGIGKLIHYASCKDMNCPEPI